MTSAYITARLRTCATPAATVEMIAGLLQESYQEGYIKGIEDMKERAIEIYAITDRRIDQELINMQLSHENNIMSSISIPS